MALKRQRATYWVKQGVPNSWSSCMERSRTESKISAKNL